MGPTTPGEAEHQESRLELLFTLDTAAFHNFFQKFFKPRLGRLCQIVLFLNLFLIQFQIGFTTPDDSISLIHGVVFVAPIYRELDSSGLDRLIDSIENLDPLDGIKIKVLFIVNNASEEAHPHYPHPEAYNENQRTLEHLRSLSDPTKRHPFRNLQNVQIHLLDHSTAHQPGIPDRTLFETKERRNIGLVRSTGVLSTLNNLIPPGEDEQWVISMMDGDSKLDTNWLHGIVKAYQDPSVQAALTQMKYFLPPGSSLDVIQTSLDQRILDMTSLAIDLIGFGPFHQWGGGSPRITARASVYRTYGGFPTLHYAEDRAFLDWLLEKKIKTILAPESTVYTSDRARPHSYDGAFRHSSLIDDKNGAMFFKHSDALHSIRDELFSLWGHGSSLRLLLDTNPRLHREWVHAWTFFRGHSLPINLLTPERQLLDIIEPFLTPVEGQELTDMISDRIDAKTEDVHRFFDQDLHGFFDLFEAAISESAPGDINDPEMIWLETWSRLRSLMKYRPKMVSSFIELLLGLPEPEFLEVILSLPRNETETRRELMRRFPDFLDLRRDRHTSRSVALFTLEAIYDAIHQAHSDPETWPGLHEWIHVINGESPPPVRILCGQELTSIDLNDTQ